MSRRPPDDKTPRTRKPCPGCGETPIIPRPADRVCDACQRLMDEATARRAALAADDRRFYRAPKYVGSFRHFSIPGEPQKDGDGRHIEYNDRMSKRLAAAFEQLARRCLEPVPYEVQQERGTDYKEIELLFPDRTAIGFEHQGQLVLARPEDVAVIRELYALICEALKTAEAAGLATGSDLLGQLAAGRLTTGDFNKKAVLADPRAAERRAYVEE